MRVGMYLAIVTALVLGLVFMPGGLDSPAAPDLLANSSQQDPALSDSSLMLIENVGQFDPRARFLAYGDSGALWLAEDALWLTIAAAPEAGSAEESGMAKMSDAYPQSLSYPAVNIRLSFAGANPTPRLQAYARLDTRIHYYRGADPAAWHTDVPVWGGVRYLDLYPGVDLEVSGQHGQLAWRLECRENCPAALQNVRLQIDGAPQVTVDDGFMHLSTSLGEYALPLLAANVSIPAGSPQILHLEDRAFQIIAPLRFPDGGDTPQDQPYPEEAFFATYLGGTDWDYAYSIAVDGSGDILDRTRAIYVAGATLSPNFPVVTGDVQLKGVTDGYVARIRKVASLVKPEFLVYLGGSVQDSARGITCDQAGNIYLTGMTDSADFPVTPDAFDATFNQCTDCVTCNSQNDAFVVKMDAAGSLLYATYLGGSHYYSPGTGNRCGYERGTALAVDTQGVVYVTGLTRSENFPTTPGAFDTVFSNIDIGLNEDTFVVKLAPHISGPAGLLYSTYVGGGTISYGEDIAIDQNGHVYVTGTTSTDPWGEDHFPTTPDAYDTNMNRGIGNQDIFIFKLDPAGNAAADLLYSTFVGASDAPESSGGIVLDAARQVYVTGTTYSPNFPTTPGAFDTACGTDGQCDPAQRDDAFVIKLNLGSQGANDLLYATYLGGNYNDTGNDIALGASGDVYITGAAGSTEGFPITPDAYDDTPSEYFDAYVVRLRLQSQGPDDLIYGTYVNGSLNDEGIAVAVDEDERVYVAGDTSSTDFPATDHAAQDFSMGWKDIFVFRLLTSPAPDLSASTKTVAPYTALAGQVVTYTVRLVNDGVLEAAVTFTDTLPAELVLQGAPVSSAGSSPVVNGQTITWAGSVPAGVEVVIRYAALLDSVPESAPTVVNLAQINDGYGNLYLRRAFLNGYRLFLPLIIR